LCDSLDVRPGAFHCPASGAALQMIKNVETGERCQNSDVKELASLPGTSKSGLRSSRYRAKIIPRCGQTAAMKYHSHFVKLFDQYMKGLF
jgi:hypothetical protein